VSLQCAYYINRAGQDGGALATYIYPSTYTIIQSTFTYNHTEDDGGAVFIGCSESILRVDYASSKTDTRDIEMMPNAVYGKYPCN
jgi:hypothetical protein